MYDMIIVGAGTAGLTAGIYALRSGVKPLILECEAMGGQITLSPCVENYPGIAKISGMEFADGLMAQLTNLGGEVTYGKVISAQKTENGFEVGTEDGEKYEGKNLIIASGAAHRHLGIEREQELIGRGVSYCATCDANFFEDFEVYVVGGGDSAVEEAMYLTKFARKVTIIHRRDELRAAKSIQEKAFKNDKLHFMWDTVVEEVGGDGILSWMTVKNVKTGEVTKIEADEDDGMFGVFGFIGTIPNSDIFKGSVEMDERGYIPTDADMHTNIPGVYAAGDVRVKSLRQVVTAAADGAIAAVQGERSMA